MIENAERIRLCIDVTFDLRERFRSMVPKGLTVPLMDAVLSDLLNVIADEGLIAINEIILKKRSLAAKEESDGRP
jgi:hypothetical protein